MSDKLPVGRINFGPSSCPHGVWPTFPCKQCGGVVPHDSKIPRQDLPVHATKDQERIATLQSQLEEARRECKEQARLNGMGASREAKLRAERDKLAALLRLAIPHLRDMGVDFQLQKAIEKALAGEEGR